MTIKTSSFGGGGLPVLTPDLTAPTSWIAISKTVKITGIDSTTGGLVTILSIPSGRGYIPFLQFENNAGDFTIKLTIDSEVIWNDVWTAPATNAILIGGYVGSGLFADAVPFKESFLLECTGTDASFNVNYMKRLTL